MSALYLAFPFNFSFCHYLPLTLNCVFFKLVRPTLWCNKYLKGKRKLNWIKCLAFGIVLLLLLLLFFFFPAAHSLFKFISLLSPWQDNHLHSNYYITKDDACEWEVISRSWATLKQQRFYFHTNISNYNKLRKKYIILPLTASSNTSRAIAT